MVNEETVEELTMVTMTQTQNDSFHFASTDNNYYYPFFFLMTLDVCFKND